MASTAAVAYCVTTRCAWPGRGESATELIPFMNSLVHSYTCCSDRHALPYSTFIHQWISMGFTPSLLKKCMTECCSSLVHVARRPPFYTTSVPSCCIPASYCHLSATLQIINIIVVNLQDNRAVFQIFIALLMFSFNFPSYVSVPSRSKRFIFPKCPGQRPDPSSLLFSDQCWLFSPGHCTWNWPHTSI